MKKEIIKWTKQGDHDLEMAKNIIDDGGYDTCAFLCQQAVEKYLKALYILLNNKPAPRTHYLDEIGRNLNVPSQILSLLKELSSDYMVSRYPDVTASAPFEEYSESDAKGKIKTAEDILSWVKSQIQI
ncbi:HEPN domain-containing protein [Candidatus Saganbacteria bacterium]|nr:HEPN domain-containing protein [Candidatus Saganbacteria bacterium]